MIKSVLFACFISLGVVASANTPPGKKTVITGIVLDAASNESLTGALVKIAGTSLFTYTDAHGKFSLEVDTSQAQKDLEISLVSFTAERLVVTDTSSELKIALHEK